MTFLVHFCFKSFEIQRRYEIAVFFQGKNLKNRAVTNYGIVNNRDIKINGYKYCVHSTHIVKYSAPNENLALRVAVVTNCIFSVTYDIYCNNIV